MHLEVQLNNGQKHELVFEGSKEEFFDLLRFNRESFLQDTKKSYFIISSIISFKITGGNNE